MLTKIKFKPLLLAVLFAVPLAHAQKVGNGGDVCAMRIAEIATDIDAWISKGQADTIELPASIPLLVYKKKMLRDSKNEDQLYG